MSTATHQHLEQAFRKSYGSIVSRLISKFGLKELDLIENAVMEAFYKAMKVLPYEGRRDDLEGWLYVVAKRNLIDEFRKKQYQHQDISLVAGMLIADEPKDLDVNFDAELQLLFTICHPDLKPADQLAFMLKTLSGFGRKEISAALLVNEETIKKRLLRARESLLKSNVEFQIPHADELHLRRDQVHRALYLLFNEGYYSSHADHWIRKDMCLEAMRLCKALSDHSCANTDTVGLMSLMCYHISRLESRIDDNGNQVSLEYQDRSKWNPFFISLGDSYLAKSVNNSDDKGIYQLEAAIGSAHCHALKFEDTKWNYINLLYQHLYILKPQVQILLSRVVVLLRMQELAQAKTLYESLLEDAFANDKSHYYLVGVELYKALQEKKQHQLLVSKMMDSIQLEGQRKWMDHLFENL